MNLPTKGLLLVSIPLLAQLGFLAVLLASRADQEEAQRLALHTTQVIAQTEQCHRLVVEAQTHMRGYVLVGEGSLAESFDEVSRQVVPAYAALRDRVKDNPAQQGLVDRMAAKAAIFRDWLSESMRLARAGRVTEVKKRVQSMEGARLLGELRGLTDTFLEQERTYDLERRGDLERARRWQSGVLVGGFALALVSTSVMLVGFSRTVSSRVGVLIDNTRRMAEGRELASPLTGKDELGELDAMFHRMAAAIRQKDQENELFVYSVSHDLRSPLVNLQGFSQELAFAIQALRELILEGELPEPRERRALQLLDGEATEAIGYIQSAVTRLAGIIDALLRLSRAGRVEYQARKNEVQAIVNRVVSAMNDTLERKRVEVSVGPLPACWGDPTAIEQIFANLIGNAVNYLDPARPGKVEVGAVDGPGGPLTTYFVRDNGLGIPEAQQPKVFVAFQRLHPGVAPGEGIGLALVRRVVERHGGQVWLESTPGVGTTFFVSLPCEREGLPLEHKSVTPIPGKSNR
jgi:signal transduction histidine kinase